MGEYQKVVGQVQQIVRNQNQWRKKECINLIASENVTSPLVDAAYQSDFSHRYAEGEPGKRFYNGIKYADEIETICNNLAKELFHAKMANCQLISGTVSNMAMVRMFTQPTSTVMSNSASGGGHISHNKMGAVGLMGNNQISFPITEDGYHLDVDASKKLIERTGKDIRNRFSLAIFGCSMFLFPQPVKELAPVIKAQGATVVYDAAHVLGLVAGKKFQQPLAEGADMMVSSTHKTFFGPQGGIMLANMDEDQWKRYRPYVFPGVLSNYHVHRFPALAIAFAEMLEFGEAYATQVTKNAKSFAAALAKEGFKVQAEEFGYTESHQTVVDMTPQGGGKQAANALEESNIILNFNLLPFDAGNKVANPSGVRIGVQEMTRWGMKEGDFDELAVIFRKVLMENKNCKDDVVALRNRFKAVQYTFDLPVA
ncbi:MAG: serine hydroxymethyltransferase [Candidatus Micrarchaeia archaeon]|jgi:glycine hydroxymethyltransferase